MINKRILYTGNYTKNANKIYKKVKKNFPQWLIETNPEIIIVAGGDGSMLHAIQKYSYMKAPFFGIGAGTLNFLMKSVEPKDFIKYIKNISLDNLEKIKTRRVKVKVLNKKNKVVFKKEAINDIIIGNKVNDYHHIFIKEDGSEKNFKGMGLIISTPLGSTAMSFNNDVPIIPSLEMPMITISSIVSERKKSFKKFSKSKKDISIKVESRTTCKILIDGSADQYKLKDGDKIIISNGNQVEMLFEDINEFEIKRASII